MQTECELCQGEIDEKWIHIDPICEDCYLKKKKKSDRLAGCVFSPIWLPIWVVALALGVIGGVIARGFKGGMDMVRVLADAWNADK